MDIATFSFTLLFIFAAVVFIYIMWSKRGRKEAIELFSGLKVVGEPFEISTERLRPKYGISYTQKLRMYPCSDGVNASYVLENTQAGFGSIARTFIKLSPQALKKLGDIHNQ